MLNPATSLSTIENVLDVVDLVLIMSVNPGFGGQKFIESQVAKTRALKNMCLDKVCMQSHSCCPGSLISLCHSSSSSSCCNRATRQLRQFCYAYLGEVVPKFLSSRNSALAAFLLQLHHASVQVALSIPLCSVLLLFLLGCEPMD